MSKKSLIGLIPRHIHNEKRIWEIILAINRYAAVRKVIPNEWMEELKELYPKEAQED